MEKLGVVRKLSPNIKIVWLMPQILLVITAWFLGTTFGLFITHETLEPIFQGVHNVVSIFIILIGFSGLVVIPSYIWAEVEHNAYTYQLDKHDIVIRWGIINRHRVVIPYDKIQDVKTDRTLFERLFGLVTLRIETAGRSHETTETAAITGISINEREDLIGDIMANVVIKRGEGPPESSAKYEAIAYHRTLVKILQELKDISVDLKEEVRSLKGKVDKKHRSRN